MLTLYSLQLTDAPQDLKDFFVKHSQIVQQAQTQIQQQEANQKALDQTQQMQDIASQEVDMTAIEDLQLEESAVNAQPTIPIPSTERQ